MKTKEEMIKIYNEVVEDADFQYVNRTIMSEKTGSAYQMDNLEYFIDSFDYWKEKYGLDVEDIKTFWSIEYENIMKKLDVFKP